METRSRQGPHARAGCVPLLQRRRVRVLVAGALVIGHLAIVGLGFVLLLWLFAPMKFIAALGVLVAASFVAWVVAVGRWSHGVAMAMQVAATTVVCVSYVAVAVVAIAAGLDDLSSRSTFATPAGEAGFMIGIAALAVMALAVLAATLPLPVRRRVTTTAALAAVIAAVGGLGAAGAVAVGVYSCEDFRFDRSRWEAALDRPDSPRQTSEAERLAHAVIRCRTVDGATRAQVRRLLGGAQRDTRRTWEWFVGETNDALGPGDAQGFYIEFGSDGRARKAYLSPP